MKGINMVIAVDLDGVICTEEKTFERALANPKQGAKEGLFSLREQGHTVVIYTARSWSEYRMTAKWLKDQQIPHDLLVMGKPVCDLWIDDRALRFSDWKSLPSQLATVKNRNQVTTGVTYPADEEFLRENRRVIFEFLHSLAVQNLPDPILEVGPMVDSRHSPMSALGRFPEFYVDTRSLFCSHGKMYQSMDIDPQVKADFTGDVAKINEVVKPNSIGTLIMLSVIEHVSELWELPRRTAEVLQPGGLLCLQTPWNLRFHGPRPDCWRISDDGYHALFGDHYDFIELSRTGTAGRELMPVCFTAILRKKNK